MWNDAIDSFADVGREADELNAVPEPGSDVQYLGFDRNPSFPRQVDVDAHASTLGLRMGRFDQTSAHAQIGDADREHHHVVPSPAQMPILKSVVEQERVATVFFNREAPALDTVLVHQHDDILEV